MFNVNLNLKAPDGPGHYVAKYSVRTNDADGVVVCATVSCDVQVDDENDCSVLLNDLMDVNHKDDEFDQRISAAGLQARAPRESMAPISAEAFAARQALAQQQPMQVNAA